MANRTVFGLAAAMGALSFLVARYDQFFFTLHFLESLIYLVILLLMFYRLEEWAYVFGMAAPVFWLLFAGAAGMLSGNVAEFGKALIGSGINSPVRVVGGVMIFVALGLLVASVRAFKKVVWGTPEAVRILAIGTGIVVAFYVSIAYALLQMATASAG